MRPFFNSLTVACWKIKINSVTTASSVMLNHFNAFRQKLFCSNRTQHLQSFQILSPHSPSYIKLISTAVNACLQKHPDGFFGFYNISINIKWLPYCIYCICENCIEFNWKKGIRFGRWNTKILDVEAFERKPQFVCTLAVDCFCKLLTFISFWNTFEAPLLCLLYFFTIFNRRKWPGAVRWIMSEVRILPALRKNFQHCCAMREEVLVSNELCFVIQWICSTISIWSIYRECSKYMRIISIATKPGAMVFSDLECFFRNFDQLLPVEEMFHEPPALTLLMRWIIFVYHHIRRKNMITSIESWKCLLSYVWLWSFWY